MKFEDSRNGSKVKKIARIILAILASPDRCCTIPGCKPCLTATPAPVRVYGYYEGVHPSVRDRWKAQTRHV